MLHRCCLEGSIVPTGKPRLGEWGRWVEHNIDVTDDFHDEAQDKADIDGGYSSGGGGGVVGGLHELSNDDGLDRDGGGISLYAAEDNDKHLDEGGLGGGLVDGVLGVEVEIIAGADDLEEGVTMDAQGDGGDGGEEGLKDEELGDIIGEGVATTDGLDKGGEEAGVGAGRGVGLAIEVGVGDELLDAVKGKLIDLEEARGGSKDKGEKDGLRVIQGEVGTRAIMERVGKGGVEEGRSRVEMVEEGSKR